MGTTDQQADRDLLERRYTELSYECNVCGLLVEGYSGDPQEAPWLFCPGCDEQMYLAVNYN